MSSPFNWVFVGHRGTGKTTLGRKVAQMLDRTYFDLDDVIAKETQTLPSEWVEDDEAGFRALEIETLEKLVGEKKKGRVISPGGGIQEIPENAFVIWIYRHGWEQIAESNRTRLRPEISMADELEWMRSSREPKYAAWASFRFEIPEGEAPDASAKKLAIWIETLERSQKSHLFKKSWWIGDASSTNRLLTQVPKLGGRGVEVRNDVLPRPLLELLFEDSKTTSKTLFSIRKEPLPTLKMPPAYVDCDLAFQHVSGKVKTKHLTYSSHPSDLSEPVFPADAKPVKWAPQVEGFSQLPEYFRIRDALRAKYKETTVIPQSRRWGWLRVVEALRANAFNYIATGCYPSEAGTPTWCEWSQYN